MSQNFEIVNLYGVSCYEQDGTAYLRLEDVARGLGFTRIASSGNQVIRWERVDGYLKELGVPTCGHGDFIPENVFYRLAMKAKNDTAEKFQSLVADEIIPSIRRTGGYIAGQEQMTDDELLSAALLVAQTKIKERDERIASLTNKNKQLKEANDYMTPRADYCDKVLQSTKTLYISTDIAKEYGWSAMKLNKMLHELHIIMKVGKNWHLYSEHDGKGYVEYKESEYYDRLSGKMEKSSYLYWTELGKAYIYDRLKKLGYLPRKEASRKVKEIK